MSIPVETMTATRHEYAGVEVHIPGLEMVAYVRVIVPFISPEREQVLDRIAGCINACTGVKL